jgi:hypothetical protein
MHQEDFDRLIRLKANKLRVINVYSLYTDALERNPSILSQLWFADSYEHVTRLYENHRDATWIALDFSSEIFLDDAEYRLDKWEEYQVTNN